MTHAFITSPSDLAALASYLRGRGAIVCSSSRELPLLAQAESVYFVVSRVSMCSTSFQQLVSDALPLVGEPRRKLLRLDDAEIPAGFSVLQSIPCQDL